MTVKEYKGFIRLGDSVCGEGEGILMSVRWLLSRGISNKALE